MHNKFKAIVPILKKKKKASDKVYLYIAMNYTLIYSFKILAYQQYE